MNLSFGQHIFIISNCNKSFFNIYSMKTIKTLKVVSVNKVLILMCMLCIHTSLKSQDNNIGAFSGMTNVGGPRIEGTTSYDPVLQQYIMTGSGVNMWFTQDQFNYLWKKIKGDFILTARVEFVGKGKEAHRKIGWMVRNSLDSNSAHIDISVHGDGLTALQFRRAPGANTEEVRMKDSLPNIVQIERKGKDYTISVAKYGDPLVSETMHADFLNDEVYAGLFVCSHNPANLEAAKFSNVRIVFPAKENFVPYKDYIGSYLEIMDMETGNRTIRFSAPNSIQAPNWTKDGKSLIYNCEGHLYNFDLKTGKPKEINTGSAINNNNDHVLSFDGTMLGISNHSVSDDSKSIIYILPVKGGEPKRITKTGPSYLHGWTPEGKDLIFTGERNGQFDIYKVNIRTGKEIRLTDAQGLDDGSEYTPDGRYIYFNSNRTGTMQIWRMKSDGSEQRQITSDGYNNWFPHISPDNKWIVFLSFPKEVSSGDHPFYKHVYLRLIPVEGGIPKVVAYLYGGQGTINVPSWSPDSKKIAFVSNTDMPVLKQQ
jgi:TolB protein